jgi:putative tricarboxylic transport membrane protein
LSGATGGEAAAAHSPFTGEKAPASARADLLTAVVLLAFGLAVVGLALRMPTFVEQSGTGLTAPGIVPGFHGTVIALLSVVLGMRALRRGFAAHAPASTSTASGTDALRLFAAAALGTIYAGVLIGRMPFWLATALFVFGFTAGFEWTTPGPRGRGRQLIEAAAIALATGWGVHLVFEDLFLVRLP